MSKLIFMNRLLVFLFACLDFLLFTSLFTASCVVALIMATEKLVLGYSVPLLTGFHAFLFGCTLLVYNIHYLVKKSSIQLSDQYAWVQAHRMWNYIFLLLGCGLVLLFMPHLPRQVLAWSLVLAVFTFAYSLPLLPFKGKHRLKDFGVVKIVLLTLVWTFATAILSIVHLGVPIASYPYEVLLRFLLLLVLCLAFDIRDMQVDLGDGIHTLPVQFGLTNTYRIIVVALLLYALVAFIQYLRFGLSDRLLVHLFTACCSYAAIRFVRNHPSDRNYQLLVDGQMMLNGLLLILC